MTCMLAVLLLSSVLSGKAAPLQSVKNSSVSEMVEINGADHPEAIPDYLAWQTGFSKLAHIKDRNIVPALDALALTRDDLALAYQESAKQSERDDACGEKTRRLMEAKRAQKAKPRDIETAVRPLILDCRQITLDAKDRLLNRLSPEGRSKLESWIDESRRTIRVQIRKDQLDFFRRPR